MKLMNKLCPLITIMPCKHAYIVVDYSIDNVSITLHQKLHADQLPFAYGIT